MPDISLIPPQQKERARPRLATFRGPRFTLPPRVKIVLLSIAVIILATAALYVWSLSLGSSIERLNEKLTAVAKDRDAALERRLKEVGELVASFEGLVKKHRTWSQLFGVIGSRTVLKVTFTAFEGSEETSSFLLRGVAPNYKTIASQVKSFEEEGRIKRVELTTLTLNTEGEIEFTMNVSFDPDLISSQD